RERLLRRSLEECRGRQQREDAGNESLRLVFGHLDAPVILLAQRHVVLLAHVLKKTRQRLGRTELPGKRFLVRLQKREERLVPELLVESAEQDRTLVVEQAGPHGEARGGVVGDPDSIGQ